MKLFLTKKNLEDLGCKNVVAVPEPAAIINGHAYPARVRMYKNLDRFKSENIFIDACNGAMLIICDPQSDPSFMSENTQQDLEEHTGGIMLRLFDLGPARGTSPVTGPTPVSIPIPPETENLMREHPTNGP